MCSKAPFAPDALQRRDEASAVNLSIPRLHHDLSLLLPLLALAEGRAGSAPRGAALGLIAFLALDAADLPETLLFPVCASALAAAAFCFGVALGLLRVVAAFEAAVFEVFFLAIGPPTVGSPAWTRARSPD